MSVIATGSVGERIEIDRYIFFSFLNSSFIFPLGLAWCWNDGWIQNIGFIDYGGVAIVHVMGGLSGFVGTYLIGPRIGLFNKDNSISYINDDEKFIQEQSDISSSYEETSQDGFNEIGEKILNKKFGEDHDTSKSEFNNYTTFINKNGFDKYSK